MLRCDWTPEALSSVLKTLDRTQYAYRRELRHHLSMKSAVLWVLILTGAFELAVTSQFGSLFYVYKKMTWLDAREFCRENHTDLCSINNQEDDDLLLKAEDRKPLCWIGLYKDDQDIWKWSGGRNATFFIWSQVQNTSEENRRVAQNKKGWHEVNCEMNQFGFCCFHSRMVLVTENKTWEEAMEHCHQLNKTLVSLTTEAALIQALQTSRKAQTDRVWTGLRYLGDRWMWVNGSTVKYQAWSTKETPGCPAWRRRCGAILLKEQQWESWDCADRLNFVCL